MISSWEPSSKSMVAVDRSPAAGDDVVTASVGVVEAPVVVSGVCGVVSGSLVQPARASTSARAAAMLAVVVF